MNILQLITKYISLYRTHVKYYNYSNNHWNGPVNLFNGFYCLSLAPDGNSMYFENHNYNDCWISTRQDTVWNTPSRFLKNFNVHSLNVTSSGNYYLSSNPAGGLGQRDICKLVVENSDTSLLGLGRPINSSANEGDFFISGDESFMIIMSNRPGGFGSTDLYISYKKNNDTWTNPKNLGTSVNTSTDDFGPYVTADNKFLFYESGYSSPSSIYWIKVDDLIDSLRYTNFVPYVKNQIPDQSSIKGELFTFTIPDSTFIDDDGNNTLTYGAKLTNGNPLPAWLTFDTLAGTFTGTPVVIETLNIRVTATDTAGAAVSTNFQITVNNSVSIEEVDGKRSGILIFPNPTDGLINLEVVSREYNFRITAEKQRRKEFIINTNFSAPPCLCGKNDPFETASKTVSVEISNLAGKVIYRDKFKNRISIDLTSSPKGIYMIRLMSGNEIITGRICLE